MKILQTITILLLLSSCVTDKKIAKICSTCPVIIKDSIREVITVTPFDTTLFLSQTGKDILFPDAENGNCCEMVDSLHAMMNRGNGTISAENNGVKSTIFKKDKKIVFRCEADSLKEVIRLLKTTITTSITKTLTVALKCKEEHRTRFDYFCRYVFFTLLGALSLFIIYKLFTIRASLLKFFTKLPL